MYRMLLRSKRIKNNVREYKAPNRPIESSMNATDWSRILREFCDPEDLMLVKLKDAADIFNRYLKENGYPEIGKNTFSRTVKETYGMTVKHVRDGNQKLAWVFYMPDANRR